MRGKANHGTPLSLVLWVVLVALLLGILAIASSPGAPHGVHCNLESTHDFGCTFEHQEDADPR